MRGVAPRGADTVRRSAAYRMGRGGRRRRRDRGWRTPSSWERAAARHELWTWDRSQAGLLGRAWLRRSGALPPGTRSGHSTRPRTTRHTAGRTVCRRAAGRSTHIQANAECRPSGWRSAVAGRGSAPAASTARPGAGRRDGRGREPQAGGARRSRVGQGGALELPFGGARSRRAARSRLGSSPRARFRCAATRPTGARLRCAERRCPWWRPEGQRGDPRSWVGGARTELRAAQLARGLPRRGGASGPRSCRRTRCAPCRAAPRVWQACTVQALVRVPRCSAGRSSGTGWRSHRGAARGAARSVAVSLADLHAAVRRDRAVPRDGAVGGAPAAGWRVELEAVVARSRGRTSTGGEFTGGEPRPALAGRDRHGGRSFRCGSTSHGGRQDDRWWDRGAASVPRGFRPQGGRGCEAVVPVVDPTVRFVTATV